MPKAVTRGKTAAPKKVADVPKVVCHFRAEMDEEVVVKRPATVEVLVSLEAIGQLVHDAAAESDAEIDPSRKLLIQVLPKVNFESVDEGWTEIDPPQPNEPQTLYFLLKASHEGDGEVWVVARQGQVPLVTLVLKPRIVKTKTQAARRTLATATTAEAPKLSAPLHQLTITERRNGDSISYRYQLQSPALELLKWGDSKPLVGDRQKYVEKLYATIENRWLSNQQDLTTSSRSCVRSARRCLTSCSHRKCSKCSGSIATRSRASWLSPRSRSSLGNWSTSASPESRSPGLRDSSARWAW